MKLISFKRLNFLIELPFMREYQIIYDVFILCAFDMQSAIWHELPFETFAVQSGFAFTPFDPEKSFVPNDLITNQNQTKISQIDVL